MTIDLCEIGIGNIGSVKRCLANLGVAFNTVSQDKLPGGDRPLVLPGVGQFGAVMESLRVNNFDQRLRQLIESGTPYLGICVGLQILFDGSDESNNEPGLGLIKGQVVRFKNGKIPQIGWNLVRSTNNTNDKRYAYFVNSYHAIPENDIVISHKANYYGDFCAAIKLRNITAAQFHPEKSADFGNEYLRGWLTSVGA